jgi:pimeloyl-ACP methyl ester carboxylesterase
MNVLEMGKPKVEGNPVFVLVHGLGMSSRYLMPTAELLAAVGTVYAPDLPGFGRSMKPSRILTIHELADSLAEWISAMNLASPVLIGNSLGAQIIVDLSARHRSHLAAAVLVGPTIDPEARRLSTQVWRLLTDIPREPPALYRIALKDYFRAGLRRCLKTLRYALVDPVAEKLPAIRVPVLVVRGQHDPIVPQRWTERVAGLIPHAKSVSVPHAAHAVNFSAPEALVKEVLEFLPEIASGHEQRPRGAGPLMK